MGTGHPIGASRPALRAHHSLGADVGVELFGSQVAEGRGGRFKREAFVVSRHGDLGGPIVPEERSAGTSTAPSVSLSMRVSMVTPPPIGRIPYILDHIRTARSLRGSSRRKHLILCG